jgi:hypothetical protein
MGIVEQHELEEAEKELCRLADQLSQHGSFQEVRNNCAVRLSTVRSQRSAIVIGTHFKMEVAQFRLATSQAPHLIRWRTSILELARLKASGEIRFAVSGTARYILTGCGRYAWPMSLATTRRGRRPRSSQKCRSRLQCTMLAPATPRWRRRARAVRRLPGPARQVPGFPVGSGRKHPPQAWRPRGAIAVP